MDLFKNNDTAKKGYVFDEGIFDENKPNTADDRICWWLEDKTKKKDPAETEEEVPVQVYYRAFTTDNDMVMLLTGAQSEKVEIERQPRLKTGKKKPIRSNQVLRVKNLDPKTLVEVIPEIQRLCIVQKTGHQDTVAEVWWFFTDENFVDKQNLLDNERTGLNIWSDPELAGNVASIEKKKTASADHLIGTALSAKAQPSAKKRLEKSL